MCFFWVGVVHCWVGYTGNGLCVVVVLDDVGDTLGVPSLSYLTIMVKTTLFPTNVILYYYQYYLLINHVFSPLESVQSNINLCCV